MARIFSVATAVGSLLAVVACGGGTKEIEVQHAPTPQVSDSVYVEVANQYFYDARVYALYEGGHRYPMGLIVGNTTSPPVAILWQPRLLAFEISFIGAPGLYLSDEIMLEPGDAIKLTIPPNIATSAFFRRR